MEVFKNSKIIWAGGQHFNQWVCIKSSFVAKKATKTFMRVSVDSKYVLYINGEMVVFDGGLCRESTPGNGYYDELDLTEHIVAGENDLSFLVWYWGNGGRYSVDTKLAGLMFEIEQDGEITHISDSNSKAIEYKAYEGSREPRSSFLYGGDNITFNANNAMEGWEKPGYDVNSWRAADEVGVYGQYPWGKLEKRPIPMHKFTKIKEYSNVYKDADTYICKLPYAMHVSPYLKIKANGGEVIDIRSDRFQVKGGSESSSYNGHRTDYIAREGEQEFIALDWYFGEVFTYKVPDTVEVIGLGYMESHYDCEVLPLYRWNDEFIDKLVDKCVRTLLVCMRDNFMDCPDRERAQWIGDVSVQVPQVYYVLSETSNLLIKKAIWDFIRLRQGNLLVGCVPGAHTVELPAQSLNAISSLGVIAKYYEHTGDKETVQLCYEPMLAYLKISHMKENGLIDLRNGGWAWFDHGNNCDIEILANAWYYSALKNLEFIAGELKITKDLQWIKERMSCIEDAFNKEFLKDNGYRSAQVLDDRANAMSVLVGLAKPESYEKVKNVLTTVKEATPFMEYYVLEALCFMGYKKEALNRMRDRYKGLVENENSTLWEDFYTLGTRNHAWSGGPLTILYKYFRGEELKNYE
ncbi:MAG: hypothetical protein IKV58_02630 [Oscillospiraceae bacterium]|nr:hypothetical protein [Oscillospiraceae bacterium]